MEADVTRYIRSLSDADLIQYVNAPAGTYRPEADALAREELSSRHLSPEAMARVQEEIARREAERLAAANATLEPLSRFLVFWTSPFNFFPVFVAWSEFRRNGEWRKATQLLKHWLPGAVVFGVLLVLRWILKA